MTLLYVALLPLPIATFILVYWISDPIKQAKRLARDDATGRNTPQVASPSGRTHASAVGSLSDNTNLTSLSVIIPAYNEEDRIPSMLSDTLSFLHHRQQSQPDFSYEIIVVDDCSSDDTIGAVQRSLKEWDESNVHIVRLPENRGKGGAIRIGVLRSKGYKILFADADNATDIKDLLKLEKAMQSVADKTQGVIVCGSRAHLEEQAIAKRNPLRNLLMYGFHVLVSTMCVKNVRDTQCGFKLLDRTAARLLFPPMHVERWAFDVELLYLAQARGLTIQEVAVQWHEVPGSKLSVVAASLTMLREIVLIRLCYLLGVWRETDGGFRLAAS